MPLALAKQGESVRIVRVSGDKKLCRRLEDMGIVAGGSITLISSSGGELIVRVRDTRLALDSGVARGIIVAM